MFDMPAPADPVRIEIETAHDAATIDALVLAAFGPGRFAKTAERIREQAAIAVGFVAREGAEIIGSVRLWRIRVGDTPAVFLGPIAVDETRRKSGLGADLVHACLEHARAQGIIGVLLVGDPPYFNRFDFRVAPDAVLAGPVDQHRVMWWGEGEAVGPVRPVKQGAPA
jgi:predicted N-acetyltransferase YhbS